jgi:hypothetical protein
VGPKSRLPQRRLPEIRDELAAAAANLSARLGHGSTEGTTGRRKIAKEGLNSGNAANPNSKGGKKRKEIGREN